MKERVHRTASVIMKNMRLCERERQYENRARSRARTTSVTSEIICESLCASSFTAAESEQTNAAPSHAQPRTVPSAELVCIHAFCQNNQHDAQGNKDSS